MLQWTIVVLFFIQIFCVKIACTQSDFSYLDAPERVLDSFVEAKALDIKVI
jgi:hypothetical protein